MSPRIRARRAAPIALVIALAGAAHGCVRPEPTRVVVGASKLDRRLARLASLSDAELRAIAAPWAIAFDAAGAPTFRVMLRARGELPAIEGATVYARVGSIVIAGVDRAALRDLAAHPGVERVELQRRKRRANDVATGTSSVLSGASYAFTKGGPPITVPLALAKGQTVTVALAKGGEDPSADYDAAGLALTSTLRLCADAACSEAPLAEASADDAGGDARVTYTAAEAGTVHVVASAGTGQAGPFSLTFVGDASVGLAYGTRARDTGKTGKGVVVGVVDTGIDWCHPDFIDPKTGASRILYLWDQALSPAKDGGVAPKGFESSGGAEYDNPAITAALASCKGARAGVGTRDRDAHGTHVAGIAAGNGQATDAPDVERAGRYAGAAPEADLVVVNALGSDVATQHTDEALLYVRDRARALGRPFVVSNSWATFDGDAQDGTSLEEEVASSVAGPGSVAVFAAGNNGAEILHARSPSAVPKPGEADTILVRTSACDPASPASDYACTERDVSFWLDGDDAYDVTVKAPTGEQATFRAKDLDPANGAVETIAGLDVALWGDTSAADEPNGLRNYFLAIPANPAGVASTEDWSITLVRTAGSKGSGRWDAYTGDLSENVWPPEFVDPDGTSASGAHVDLRPQADGVESFVPGTVNSPAAAFGVIAVGALSASRARWLDASAPGGGYAEPVDTYDVARELGDLAYFSSRGPTRDGRAVPQLAAPGTNIASSRSRDDTEGASVTLRDGEHLVMSGTSMATPNVSGVVAQILEVDPTNFPRPLLVRTAKHDAATADAAAPNGWNGAGKVDAVAALAALAKDAPPVADSLAVTPPSPAAGATMTLEANAHDPDGDDTIAEYLWDVDGDGLTDAFTTKPTLAWPAPATKGTHTADVVVVDAAGRTARASAAYAVGDAPDGGAPDAGSDAGPAADAGGARDDAGTTAQPTSDAGEGGSGGCGCELPGARGADAGRLGALATLVGLALARRRRR
jgi:subtilisin family serine protease